jgi:hypothetical protein
VHIIVLWKTTIFPLKHNGDCQDVKEHVIWGDFRNNIKHMSGNDNYNARYDVTLCLQQHMQWPIGWNKKMHVHASFGSLVQWFIFPRHCTYLKKKMWPNKLWVYIIVLQVSTLSWHVFIKEIDWWMHSNRSHMCPFNWWLVRK